MEMWLLIILLAINAGAAIAFMITQKNRVDDAGMWGLFFILVPGAGFLVYAIQHGSGVPRSIASTLKDASVGPGGTEAARAQNLKQLHKELEGNYKFLLLAKRDEQPEDMPDYALTVQQETRRADEALWLQRQRDFDKDPDDPKAFHAVCDALLKLIANGAVSGSDRAEYNSDLCRLVQGELDNHPDVVTPTEFEACLQALIDMKSYEAAEKLWQNAAPRLRTETAYEDMLAMYYTLRDRNGFQRTLENLRKDDKIRLSSTGREQMRYWTKRLADAS